CERRRGNPHVPGTQRTQRTQRAIESSTRRRAAAVSSAQTANERPGPFAAGHSFAVCTLDHAACNAGRPRRAHSQLCVLCVLCAESKPRVTASPLSISRRRELLAAHE